MDQNPSNDKNLGVASLVLGILSLVGGLPIFALLSIPCAIAGIVTGHMARRRNAKNGLAVAGLITSYVAVVLWIAIATVSWTAFSAFESAKTEEAKKSVVSLRVSAEGYRSQKGECPNSIKDLKAAGFVGRVSMDPWGNEFRVECSGGRVEVVSAGPDRDFHTDDDIRD